METSAWHAHFFVTHHWNLDAIPLPLVIGIHAWQMTSTPAQERPLSQHCIRARQIISAHPLKRTRSIHAWQVTSAPSQELQSLRDPLLGFKLVGGRCCQCKLFLVGFFGRPESTLLLGEARGDAGGRARGPNRSSNPRAV